MFQSLFYWKYHFNLSSFVFLMSCFGVSILILLEVPLQLIRTSMTSVQQNKVVSILILLEVPLQLMVNVSIFVNIYVFQSLFYWKYHFNCFSIRRIFCLWQVSILILLEVPLQLLGTYVLYISKKSFNPYFTGSTTSTLL